VVLGLLPPGVDASTGVAFGARAVGVGRLSARAGAQLPDGVPGVDRGDVQAVNPPHRGVEDEERFPVERREGSANEPFAARVLDG
jgi:hypothetical protein